MGIFIRKTAISSLHLFCISSAAFVPRVSTCADYYAKLAEVEENLRKARESREMQVLAILRFPLTALCIWLGPINLKIRSAMQHELSRASCLWT